MPSEHATIRKASGGDRDNILGVISAAFEREEEAALMRELWRRNAVHVEFVAEISGVIVGHCAFSAITTKPVLDGLLLGLSPVSVAPHHQNQGIGSAIIRAGLKSVRQDSVRMIVVLGHPEYYVRFGFELASRHNFAWAQRDAGEAFRVICCDDIDTTVNRDIRFHPAFDLFD